MPLIPILVTIVVGVFLTIITGYFGYLVVMSESQEHHRPAVLQD